MLLLQESVYMYTCMHVRACMRGVGGGERVCAVGRHAGMVFCGTSNNEKLMYYSYKVNLR